MIHFLYNPSLHQGQITYVVIGVPPAPTFFTVNTDGNIVVRGDLRTDRNMDYTVSLMINLYDPNIFFHFNTWLRIYILYLYYTYNVLSKYFFSYLTFFFSWESKPMTTWVHHDMLKLMSSSQWDAMWTHQSSHSRPTLPVSRRKLLLEHQLHQSWPRMEMG